MENRFRKFLSVNNIIYSESEKFFDVENGFRPLVFFHRSPRDLYIPGYASRGKRDKRKKKSREEREEGSKKN